MSSAAGIALALVLGLTDGATAGRQSPLQSSSLNDDWMVARAEVALFADPRVTGARVADMMIHAADGVVTLEGDVASADARRAAEEIAWTAGGVKDVLNELAVVPDDISPPVGSDASLGKDIAHLLRNNDELRGSEIDVRISAGAVQLSGRVPDIPARALASRVARSVVGVTAVKNDLWPERLQLSAGTKGLGTPSARRAVVRVLAGRGGARG